jgi:sulfur-carrier protein adenylyltransferase/sulfurtransferase
MTVDRLRHGRQIRLPEIGEAGQERLAASEVVLCGVGDAREIEAAYLARAGVRVVDDANAEIKAKAKADANGTAKLRAAALASLGMHDSIARETADGALRALLAMREILGIEGAGGTK